MFNEVEIFLLADITFKRIIHHIFDILEIGVSLAASSCISMIEFSRRLTVGDNDNKSSGQTINPIEESDNECN